MIVDVMKMLGTRPENYAARVDELATRLVAGDAVGRDEIRIFLERIDATPEELQAAVDRLTRRRELLDLIRDAMPARKRLGDIQAEIATAQADADRAIGIVDRLREKYGVTAFDLQTKVDAADKATAALVELRNLPPAEAERLKAARAAADEATDEFDRLRREVPRLRHELAEAEKALADERATLVIHPNDPRVAEQVQRATNRVKACGVRLKDAEAATVQAERAIGDARRQRDRVEADIKAKYGSG